MPFSCAGSDSLQTAAIKQNGSVRTFQEWPYVYRIMSKKALSLLTSRYALNGIISNNSCFSRVIMLKSDIDTNMIMGFVTILNSRLTHYGSTQSVQRRFRKAQ